MALIPNLIAQDLGDTFDNEVIYEESIYFPTYLSNSSNLTLEILNGGLEEKNYKDDGYVIDPAKVQPGSFAQGYYFGFDRNDFICAEQQEPLGYTVAGSGTVMQKRMVHSSLAADLFIPFQPKLVLFGFQALFCQESTYWKTGVTDLDEVEDFFDVTLKGGQLGSVSNNNIDSKYYQKLPTTRRANGPGGRAGLSKAVSKLPLPDEDSFRFVSRQGQLSGANVRAGYFTFRVTVGALSHNDDIKKQELLTPTGSIWVLALR
tara:strand:+ start:27900 stop:28682 length:783 start_codon:yes stop_codon:yes gene_type:complete